MPARKKLVVRRAATEHDPEKQVLFEIFSGHGNSEEYREWRAVSRDASGNSSCAEPTAGYVPCCWQAGEIIRSRCADPSAPECERRVEEARRNYVEAGIAGHLTVPGVLLDEWKDCGQCSDCFVPAFNYRPGNSAHHAFNRVRQAVGEVVHRIDDPAVTGAMMVSSANPIHERVTEIDVR